MASNTHLWSALSLQRYRPAILALTALAAGYAIYHIHESVWNASASPKKTPALQRSNAIRRRRSHEPRGQLNGPEEGPNSLEFLTDPQENGREYGWHRFRLQDGESRLVALTRASLLAVTAAPSGGFSEEETVRFRAELEPAFLNVYFYHHLRGRLISEADFLRISGALEQNGFSTEAIRLALDRLRDGEVITHITRWILQQSQDFQRSAEDIVNTPGLLAEWIAATQRPDEQMTVVDTDSEASWQGEDREDRGSKEGQNLLNLLFQIAEEQGQKEGHIHRGITCNSCGLHPIKGVRYRCVNCLDFDLCESCEAVQPHPKTHVFYKVRIPRAHLGHQPQPVLYPGHPEKLPRVLPREMVQKFSRQTEYKESEICGFWDQFVCLASVSWPTDPNHFNLAIDSRGFELLFLPSHPTRPPPPNLIYDRVFTFYDSDGNDLIGFEEFIMGLSALNKHGPKQKWKRIFQGFDIDGDGYVDRRDFLRMFKAHYALMKQMTTEVVAGMEEDSADDRIRELVTGGQALSSAFTHDISPGQESRPRHGKIRDEYGDQVVFDRKGAVDEGDEDGPDSEEMIADHAELQTFSTTFEAEMKTANPQEIVKSILKDQWPPSVFDTAYAPACYGRSEPAVDLHGITNPEDQANIRIASHACLAVEWRRHHHVRCQAVRERRKRHLWFSTEGLSKSRLEGTPSDGTTGPGLPGISTNVRSGYRIFLEPGKAREKFMEAAVKLVIALPWPIFDIVAEEFCGDIMTLIIDGWTSSDIVENLKGYSLDTSEIEDFVRDFLSLLETFTPAAATQDESQTSALPLRRSRSSSKVRFEDGLNIDDDERDTRSVASMSSKSIPVNERWGGFGIPEPEEDVGREILYQVTQEAFNEVIDPLCKAREDLWLEARATKEWRDQNRADICSAVTRPREIADYVHWFLGQIRVKLDYPTLGPYPESNEAHLFCEFVTKYEERKPTRLTSEKCPMCKGRFIFLGECCGQCGSQSAQMKQDLEDLRTQEVEVCTFCKGFGTDSKIQYERYCGNCANPSESRAREDQKLWQILTGEDSPPIGQYGPVNRESSNDAKLNTGMAETENSDVQSSKQPDLNNLVRMDGSPPPATPKSPGSEGSPKVQAGQVAAPTNTIPGVSQQSVPGNQHSETEAYPEMALDLHSAVEAFNEADLSIERKVAQKPLDELLEESGYEIIDERSSHGPRQSESSSNPPPRNSSLRDPTLPQNRPNSDGDTSFTESSNDKPTVDSTDAEAHETKSSTTHQRRTPEELERDKGKLKYWAALYILEAEEEARGGPGRLSEKEFLQIVLGERGRSLEFIGEWMNLTAF